MKPIIMALIFAVLLSSCINFKSEYAEIDYYRLKQIPNESLNIGHISGTLQIRDFTISQELETDHLLALWDETQVQRYFYHRWITDASSLISDFFINRFNFHKAFTHGTVKAASMLTPNYIIEGQVIEFIAHNSKSKEAGSNFTNISIMITLFERVSLSSQKKIVFTKLYTAKTPRKNSKAISIPLAFSKGMSEITDQVMMDIHQAILKFEKK